METTAERQTGSESAPEGEPTSGNDVSPTHWSVVRAVCLAVLVAGSMVAGTAAGVGADAGTGMDDAGTEADTSDVQQAREISSCTTITRSGEYVLTRDVGRNADQTCIAIEADDVVLDGAGHTVEGDGTNGILVTGDGVTVRNLTAEDWLFGIRFFGVERGIVTDTTTNDNRIGVSVSDSENVEVRTNDASGNENNGVSLVRSDSNAVRNNTIRDNGQIGLVVQDSDDNALIDNVISENDIIGVHLAYSENNALRRNEINETTYGVGIQVSAGNNNEIVNNVVIYNRGSGIVLVNTVENAVTENTVCRNRGGYIVETPGSVGNVVENNRDDC